MCREIKKELKGIGVGMVVYIFNLYLGDGSKNISSLKLYFDIWYIVDLMFVWVIEVFVLNK